MPAVPATTCLVACAARCSSPALLRSFDVIVMSVFAVPQKRQPLRPSIPVLIPRFRVCAPLPQPPLTLPPLPLPLNLQPPPQQNLPLLRNLHPYRDCLGQSAGGDDICAPQAAAG